MPSVRIAQLWPLLKRAWAGWGEDKASRLAASLALYTMLSLAPLLVIAVRVVALALDDDAASGEVERRAKDFVGPEGAKFAAELIRHASEAKAGTLATVISLIMLLFGATGFFIALQDAMNTIWHVQPRPNARRFGFLMDMVHTRIRSAAMVLGMGLLVIAAAAASTALSALAGKLPASVRGVSFALDLLLSLTFFTAAFAAVFRFVPDVKLAWRDVWLGAAVTAGLFTLGKYALALYFRFGVTTSAYGAAGSLAAVLIWVYYSAQIFFFGAEFTKAYAERHGPGVVPEEHAVHLTEAALAAQGIPSGETVERAVQDAEQDPSNAARAYPTAGALALASGDARRRVVGKPGRRTTGLVLAAGGLVLGAIAGGLGVFYCLTGRMRRAARRG